jgi:hypothetical protein
MKQAVRLFAIACIFCLATVAWWILGAVMSKRLDAQSGALHQRVADLWGQPQAQEGPKLTFGWDEQREETREETTAGVTRTIREQVVKRRTADVSPASSRVAVDLKLDQRLKGLVWYSLYDVDFRGAWTYVHARKEHGTVAIRFAFPDPKGVYDGFRVVVNGKPQPVRPDKGAVTVDVAVAPGERVAFSVVYRSRGMNDWSYVQEPGVASLRDFALDMTTDFVDIDFPASTMSPNRRERSGSGWKLGWAFEQVVTGHAIGMSMPKRIQPGELASALSFSAPVSLLFFFLMVLVLGKIRGLEIHPMNYLFLAAAFFAFHLLFAYSVDHLRLVPAFVVSSVVSIALVTSYLRLAVSPRFAFVEAAAMQLVYLVGFSLAHFWDGFTGLTVTVLSVLTLFLLMQLTGRVRWGREGTEPDVATYRRGAPPQ